MKSDDLICPLCHRPVDLHHMPAKLGKETAHDYCIRMEEKIFGGLIRRDPKSGWAIRCD